MRIRNVRVETQGNKISLLATCTIRHFGDDEVYITFPKKYKTFIRADASPFAAMLLIPSMKKGEDLIIEGTISEKLYHNMQHIMKVMLGWKELGLKPIRIIVDGTTQDAQQANIEASFFSGGVDSFYTFFKNKTSKKQKLTHIILVHGFDIELRNQELWQKTRKHAKTLAHEENISIIDVSCNIYRLITPFILWEHAFGGCMAAIALALRQKLQKIYLASSYRYDQQFPGGSHSAIDKYWSTEKLTFVHHGGDVTRFEKVKYIANFSHALKHLRICNDTRDGTYNCGVCDKCVRTMISLAIVGKLNNASTLPKKLDLALVKNLAIQHEFSAIFQRENLAALQQNHPNPKLEEAIEQSLKKLSNNHHNALPDTVLSKLIYADNEYNRGRIYELISYLRYKLFL